jgi:surface antigen
MVRSSSVKKAILAGLIALFAFGSASHSEAKTVKSKPKAVKLSAHVDSGNKTVRNDAVALAPKSTYWQCVTYARSITGLEIYGDAWTWWSKGQAKYQTGFHPKPGAVLVFRPQGKMKLGHVAVVSQMITDRYIQVTHANWSPVNGRRGQVEKNVNVLDVSDAGDWSRVKVWYGPLNDVGTSVYVTYGFIYHDPFKAVPVQVASNEEALPDELKTALTPYQEVENQENRANVASASRTAVRVGARLTGTQASDIVDALTSPDAVTANTVAAKSKPVK